MALRMMERVPKRRRATQQGIVSIAPTYGRVVLSMAVLACIWLIGSIWILSRSSSSTSGVALSEVRHLFHRQQEGQVQLQHQPKLQYQPRQQENVSTILTPILTAFESPLLVFTCNRAEYLKRSLQVILETIDEECLMGCPVIVSQDGDNLDVAAVISEFQKKFDPIPLIHIQHPPVQQQLRGTSSAIAYQKLAIHYGWALGQVFSKTAYDGSSKIKMQASPSPKRVIILEEDILVAPDFFDYFAATSSLLDNDPTLLAVSAFNDNGKNGKVKDSTRLLRSDFFPGLGWMMSRTLWDKELSTKWPTEYWDDWLRLPEQRKGRHVLRPEVSRSYHFGFQGGASLNQFGDHLQNINLAHDKVDWATQDLTYLEEGAYDKQYWDLVVTTSTVATNINDAMSKIKGNQNVRLEYVSFQEFKKYAHVLNLMEDEKCGVPRTAYKGIIETRLGASTGRNENDIFLFLTPPLEELKRDFGMMRR